MRQSTVDTAIITFCTLAPVAPGIYAKQLVVVGLAAFLVRILISSNCLRFYSNKLIAFLLLCPGILIAANTAPEHLIRFSPALLLLFGFPFAGLKIKSTPVSIAAVIIISYLVITQILIAYGNSVAIGLRSEWYPVEENIFEYGYIESIVTEFGKFRQGGVFYNPNVLGLVIANYYMIFTIASLNIFMNKFTPEGKAQKTIYYAITFMVILSVYLTGSRTAIIALLGFIIFFVIGTENIWKRLMKPKIIFIVVVAAGFNLIILWERLWQGFSDPTGSAVIKYQILTNYLENASISTLMVGGIFNVTFDSEYGYWIGATGFAGMAAWVIILSHFYRLVPLTRPVIFALLLMAIGNSVFYGLLTATIAVVLLIFTSAKSTRAVNEA